LFKINRNMSFTPEKITDDILKGLRMEKAPERVLIEAYLDTVIKRIKKEAIEEHTKEEKYFHQFHPQRNRR
jgi:hypothetical protein